RRGDDDHDDDDGYEADPVAGSRDAGAETALQPGLRLAGPNPGSRTELEFTVDQDAKVSLQVFDVQGRVVRTLFEQASAAGTFRARWDGLSNQGQPVGRGVYFVRLMSNGRMLDHQKVVLN